MKYTSTDPAEQARIDAIYEKVLEGDGHAYFRYARFIFDGPHEIDDGMLYLRKAYDAGDVEAAYALGYIFSSFRSRPCLGDYDWLWQVYPADDKFAYEHFLHAAEHGHLLSMMEVGTMLTWGAGCERDVETAYVWFQKLYGKESLCEAGCAVYDEYTNDGVLQTSAIYSRTVHPFCSESVCRELTDEGAFLTISDGELVDILAPMKICQITFPKSVKTIPPDILSGLTNLKKSCIPFRDNNE